MLFGRKGEEVERFIGENREKIGKKELKWKDEEE